MTTGNQERNDTMVFPSYHMVTLRTVLKAGGFTLPAMPRAAGGGPIPDTPPRGAVLKAKIVASVPVDKSADI